MMVLVLSAALVVGAPQDTVPHRGPGFSLEYPRKNTKLQPPSANVPFQMEYRKNSLLRLETERLVQAIDLSDETFASIFLEVQLEHLRERVSVPLDISRIRRFSWGTGVEYVYFLPARSGKRDRRDQVTEVVTTSGETLYRFTFWIPERDLGKVAQPLRAVLESFRPDSRLTIAETSSEGVTDDAPAPTARYRFSLNGVLKSIQAYRRQIGQEEQSDEAIAESQAHLAESLGWKAYLEGTVSSEELEEMRRAAETAGRLAPRDADSHQAQAYSAYHSSRMVEMETAIKEAIELDPDDAESYLLYAIWYGFNPAQSETLAEQALERDPDLVGAYYVKAVAARRAGKLSEAGSALERAVELDPTFAAAYLALATVLKESGDVAGALKAHRRTVAAAPENMEARFALAVALRQGGHLDEAITEYRKITQLDPDLPEAYYNLAVLYLQEKREPDLAAQYFQRYLELDPENQKASRIRDWLKSRGYR